MTPFAKALQSMLEKGLITSKAELTEAAKSLVPTFRVTRPADEIVDVLPSALEAGILSHRGEVVAFLNEVSARVSGYDETQEQAAATATPIMPIEDSVTNDAISCLVCGQSFKMVKRHLNTVHGLSPKDYRERFGLPADYPLVAPKYAEKRSTLARTLGLGRKSGVKRASAKEASSKKAAAKKPAEA